MTTDFFKIPMFKRLIALVLIPCQLTLAIAPVATQRLGKSLSDQSRNHIIAQSPFRAPFESQALAETAVYELAPIHPRAHQIAIREMAKHQMTEIRKRMSGWQKGLLPEIEFFFSIHEDSLTFMQWTAFWSDLHILIEVAKKRKIPVKHIVELDKIRRQRTSTGDETGSLIGLILYFILLPVSLGFLPRYVKWVNENASICFYIRWMMERLYELHKEETHLNPVDRMKFAQRGFVSGHYAVTPRTLRPASPLALPAPSRPEGASA